MSALRMLACRAVHLHEMSADDRRVLLKDARDEAHSRGYWISGCKHLDCCSHNLEDDIYGRFARAAALPAAPHKLTRWNKKLFRNPRRPGITDRNTPLVTGTFADCCRDLVSRITPSDHEINPD